MKEADVSIKKSILPSNINNLFFFGMAANFINHYLNVKILLKVVRIFFSCVVDLSCIQLQTLISGISGTPQVKSDWNYKHRLVSQ